MLILFLEINLKIGPACIIDRSMKLLNLLEAAKLSLHTFHQRIHLFQRTSIR